MVNKRLFFNTHLVDTSTYFYCDFSNKFTKLLFFKINWKRKKSCEIFKIVIYIDIYRVLYTHVLPHAYVSGTPTEKKLKTFVCTKRVKYLRILKGKVLGYMPNAQFVISYKSKRTYHPIIYTSLYRFLT